LAVERLVRAGRLVTVSPLGTIEDGAVAIDRGTIVDVGPWAALGAAHREAEVLDAAGLVVSPGLVDCHTHNLEFGAGTKWEVGQVAQLAGAATLLLDAVRAGVTAMGEHVLGHYLFRRPIEEYRAFAASMPQTFRFAIGGGVIGTEPLACSCALMPGVPAPRNVLLDPAILRELAAANDFPGECCFATVTPANLPVSLTPHAGERAYSRDELAVIGEAYHAGGGRLGAHMEGSDAVAEFLAIGGDVIHHGHGMTDDQLPALTERGVILCATPSGGTSRRPNSPDEIAAAVAAGVTVAIATDSVLPIHPEATWYDRPDGYLIESADLMYVAQPAMRRLVADGASVDDALALITLNGAKVIGLQGELGSLEAGKRADLVFAAGVPGLEATSPDDVKLVMIGGEVVFDRRTS
jgi:imidazolonepropionase-like amidohydrolase